MGPQIVCFCKRSQVYGSHRDVLGKHKAAFHSECGGTATNSARAINSWVSLIPTPSHLNAGDGGASCLSQCTCIEFFTIDFYPSKNYPLTR